MDILIAGVDIGADAVKVVYQFYNPETGAFSEVMRKRLPSVMVEMESKRSVLQYESSPWYGLHMEVESGPLKKTVAIGKLATSYSNKLELPLLVKKSESDQVLIELYGFLAAISAEHNPKYQAWCQHVLLTTGIPLIEYKYKSDAQKVLNSKLMMNEGVHRVKFLQTPEWENKTCELKFINAITMIEGISATRLVLKAFQEKQLQNVIIADLGGSSLELCAFNAETGIDNKLSTGESIGVNRIYDEMIKSISMEYNYTFRTRNDFVDKIMIKQLYDLPGNRGNIKSLVMKNLEPLAKQVQDIFAQNYRTYSEAEAIVPIGGGTIAIRDYLEQCKDLPLLFWPEKGEEVWLNALSYHQVSTTLLRQSMRSGQVVPFRQSEGTR